MSNCSTSRSRCPAVDLEIIYPTARGHWTDLYSEDTEPTSIEFDNFDSISRFVTNVRNSQAYADRIRFIRVHFVSDNAGRPYSFRIAEVLPVLRYVETLRLEECFDTDFGILSAPVSFQRLTSLTCDFPPSPEFERFLAANPTITELFCGGSVDLNDHIGPGKTLSPNILPNLTVIECDVFLMRYYIPHRPIREVIPRQVVDVEDPQIEAEFASLRFSTASGGIAAGGGLKTLHLGRNYPLERLAPVAPNLLKLYVYYEGYGVSFIHQDLFWTTPDWGQKLKLLRSLRHIYVRSNSLHTRDEQSGLVARWSAGNTALDCVTFESNPPTVVPRISSLPELVHGGPDDDDDDSDSDNEEEDESDDSDDPDERGRDERAATVISRWIWDYDVGGWFVRRD